MHILFATMPFLIGPFFFFFCLQGQFSCHFRAHMEHVTTYFSYIDRNWLCCFVYGLLQIIQKIGNHKIEHIFFIIAQMLLFLEDNFHKSYDDK